MKKADEDDDVETVVVGGGVEQEVGGGGSSNSIRKQAGKNSRWLAQALEQAKLAVAKEKNGEKLEAIPFYESAVHFFSRSVEEEQKEEEAKRRVERKMRDYRTRLLVLQAQREAMLATAHDQKREWQNAVRAYENTVAIFLEMCKLNTPQSENLKVTLKDTMTNYLNRAEEIKSMLQKKQPSSNSIPSSPSPSSSLLARASSAPATGLTRRPKSLSLLSSPSFSSSPPSSFLSPQTKRQQKQREHQQRRASLTAATLHLQQRLHLQQNGGERSPPPKLLTPVLSPLERQQAREMVRAKLRLPEAYANVLFTEQEELWLQQPFIEARQKNLKLRRRYLEKGFSFITSKDSPDKESALMQAAFVKQCNANYDVARQEQELILKQIVAKRAQQKQSKKNNDNSQQQETESNNEIPPQENQEQEGSAFALNPIQLLSSLRRSRRNSTSSFASAPTTPSSSPRHSVVYPFSSLTAVVDEQKRLSLSAATTAKTEEDDDEEWLQQIELHPDAAPYLIAGHLAFLLRRKEHWAGKLMTRFVLRFMQTYNELPKKENKSNQEEEETTEDTFQSMKQTVQQFIDETLEKVGKMLPQLRRHSAQVETAIKFTLFNLIFPTMFKHYNLKYEKEDKEHAQKLKQLRNLSQQDMSIDPRLCIPLSSSPSSSKARQQPYQPAIETLRELPLVKTPVEKCHYLAQTSRVICDCAMSHVRNLQRIREDEEKRRERDAQTAKKSKIDALLKEPVELSPSAVEKIDAEEEEMEEKKEKPKEEGEENEGIMTKTAKQKKPKRPRAIGADELLPIFCYVLVKAQLPHIYSEVMFIQDWMDESSMLGEDGYCFAQFMTAVQAILHFEELTNQKQEDEKAEESTPEEETQQKKAEEDEENDEEKAKRGQLQKEETGEETKELAS